MKFEELPRPVRYLGYLGMSVVVALVFSSLPYSLQGKEDLVLLTAIATAGFCIMDMAREKIGEEEQKEGSSKDFFVAQFVRLIAGSLIFFGVFFVLTQLKSLLD